MPTYEYKCTKCGHQFEAFQSMSETPVTICPRCSGPVKRLISGGAGLIFKGSGFYITDYKRSGEKKDAAKEPPKKDSKEKSESTTKPSTASDKPKDKSGD